MSCQISLKISSTFNKFYNNISILFQMFVWREELQKISQLKFIWFPLFVNYFDSQNQMVYYKPKGDISIEKSCLYNTNWLGTYC